MTKTIDRLSSIAQRLAPEQQQVLVDIAEDLARGGRFYDTMSAEQHSALDEAIAEANAGGGGISSEEHAARLDALFKRHGA